MGWYVHDLNLGVTRYARDADWILDDSASHCGVIPPDWHGDGILTVTTAVSTPLSAFVERTKVPVVDLSAASTNRKYYRVQPDNVAIGRIAAEEFLRRGFKHVAFYCTDPNAPVIKERMAGFMDIFKQVGIKTHLLDFAERYRTGKLEGLTSAIGRELKKLPRPLGVMGQFDPDANTVVKAAMEAGLNVPEDVAVIGVDNDPIYSTLGIVPLTSVISNMEMVGYKGAELLDRLMRGAKASAQPIRVPPGGIVVRRSTDVFAAEDEAISKALAFISKNLKDAITVADVVLASGVCRRTLFAKFTERLGRSIHRELLRQRVAKVKLMLSSTDEKLEMIAAECGFGSHSVMWSAFRVLEGVSPSKFRTSEQLRHSPDTPVW